MKTAILQHDLEMVLGLDELNQSDRDIFLDNLGSLILEKACMRFASELDDETAITFGNTISQTSDAGALFAVLQRDHPRFGIILEEEIERFKTEAEQLTAARK